MLLFFFTAVPGLVQTVERAEYCCVILALLAVVLVHLCIDSKKRWKGSLAVACWR